MFPVATLWLCHVSMKKQKCSYSETGEQTKVYNTMDDSNVVNIP